MIKLLLKLVLRLVLYFLAVMAGASVLLMGIGITSYYPNASDAVLYTLLAVAFVWLLFSDSDKEAGSENKKSNNQTK